jgi:hypothetical protein
MERAARIWEKLGGSVQTWYGPEAYLAAGGNDNVDYGGNISTKPAFYIVQVLISN